jgi:nucleotide-binding universal stress UspA family protein
VAEKVLHTTHTPLLLVRPTTEDVTVPPTLTQIVVPLDGSALAEAALPVAEALAAGVKVPLILVRVVEVPFLGVADPTGMGYASDPQILDSLQQTANDYVNRCALSLRGKDFSVHVEAPVGLPAEEIVKYAREHPGSLVVMTTHGRTGLAGFVLGSVARRVVLHGDTPTLVVRPPVTSTAVNPSTSKD